MQKNKGITHILERNVGQICLNNIQLHVIYKSSSGRIYLWHYSQLEQEPSLAGSLTISNRVHSQAKYTVRELRSMH